MRLSGIGNPYDPERTRYTVGTDFQHAMRAADKHARTQVFPTLAQGIGLAVLGVLTVALAIIIFGQ